jgi:hypothetical protein
MWKRILATISYSDLRRSLGDQGIRRSLGASDRRLMLEDRPRRSRCTLRSLTADHRRDGRGVGLGGYFFVRGNEQRDAYRERGRVHLLTYRGIARHSFVNIQGVGFRLLCMRAETSRSEILTVFATAR